MANTATKETKIQEEQTVEFTYDELNRTKKEDARTAKWYMEYITSDDRLKRLIAQNRCPLIITFSDNNCNIVFPPSPMISRNKNEQQITRLMWANEDGSDKYVFHSTKSKKGPRTICSYAVVGRKEAVVLKKRIVKLLQELNKPKLAERYKTGHDLLSFYDTRSA